MIKIDDKYNIYKGFNLIVSKNIILDKKEIKQLVKILYEINIYTMNKNK